MKHPRSLRPIAIASLVLTTGSFGSSGSSCAAQQRAPEAQPSAPSASVSAPSPTNQSYRIGPGDVIDIVVFKQPDYTQTGVRVDNDGMIPVARDTAPLRAACRTAEEVATEIRTRYIKYLRDPFVTVTVKEFNSQPVAVIGAVNAPGRFQLQRPVRLLELLALVNGPSPLAGDSVLVIRTATASCPETSSGATAPVSEAVATYRLDDTLNATDSANPFLAPGDIIRVPDANQAYVVGSVKSPRAVPLRGPVTLTEAIAQSGGLLPDANRSKVHVLRRVSGSQAREEVIIDFDDIAKRKTTDIQLRPDDIVEVAGPSGTTKFLGTLKQILVPATIQYPLQIIR